MGLRGKLIRLAHENKALRAEVLSILKTAAVKRPSEFAGMPHYTSTDIQKFCDDTAAKGFLRMKTHEAWTPGRLLSSPMYALGSDLFSTFGGPIGRALRERSLKAYLADAPDTGDKLARGIMGTIGPDNILEMKVGNQYSYLTWITDDGKNVVSTSFYSEKEKKAPGIGMKPYDVQAALKEQGLVPAGGGTQWTYYGLDSKPGEGYFVRLGKRSVRLVNRWRQKGYEGRLGPLQDSGADREYAFGNMTPDMLTEMVEYVKKHSKGKTAASGTDLVLVAFGPDGSRGVVQAVGSVWGLSAEAEKKDLAWHKDPDYLFDGYYEPKKWVYKMGAPSKSLHVGDTVRDGDVAFTKEDSK